MQGDRRRAQFETQEQMYYLYLLKTKKNAFPTKKEKEKKRSNFYSISTVTFIVSQLNQTSATVQPYPCGCHLLFTAIPAAILIQLLTLVYAIVLSEDTGGGKLYLL